MSENFNEDSDAADSPWASIDPQDNLTDEWPQEAASEPKAPSGGGWTIIILCLGLALISVCVIIPQADANRRLAYERQRLQMDLHQIQKQVSVNQEFLQKIETDPQLAERLARRQMKVVPQGETVLDLSDSSSAHGAADVSQMSPYSIVKIPPPPALAPYQPIGGILNEICRQPQSQLYVLGAGMILVAAGLVLGDKALTANQNINSRD